MKCKRCKEGKPCYHRMTKWIPYRDGGNITGDITSVIEVCKCDCCGEILHKLIPVIKISDDGTFAYLEDVGR